MTVRVRGRVWQCDPPDRRRAARVRAHDWSGATWCFEVAVEGIGVVLSDNTGHWRPVYDMCRASVEAVERVLIGGPCMYPEAWQKLVKSRGAA